MKSKILLLMLLFPLAACSTVRSSPALPALDKLTAPTVREYTRAQQKSAGEEMLKYCSNTPTMCMFINDYGRLRDSSRALRGLKVDPTR